MLWCYINSKIVYLPHFLFPISFLLGFPSVTLVLCRIYSQLSVQSTISSALIIIALCRHKTRQHIGQLAKETAAKLKSASDHDHNKPATVSFSTLNSRGCSLTQVRGKNHV